MSTDIKRGKQTDGEGEREIDIEQERERELGRQIGIERAKEADEQTEKEGQTDK